MKSGMKALKHGAITLAFTCLILTPVRGQVPVHVTITEEANGLKNVHLASDGYETAALVMEWTFKPALEVERTGTGEAWALALSARWAADTVGTGLHCHWTVTPTGFAAQGDAASVAEWGALLLRGIRTPTTDPWERVQAAWIDGWDASYHIPSTVAERILQTEMFSLRHPYGERVLPSNIEAITASDVVSHGAVYWHPNNGLLVLSSPLTLEGIPEPWTEILTDWPAREIKKPALSLPSRPRQIQAFIAESGGYSVHTAVGQLLRLKPNHPDALPMLLMTRHLDAASAGSCEVVLDAVASRLHFSVTGTASDAIGSIQALQQAMVTSTRTAPTKEALASWKRTAFEETSAALESPLEAAHLFIHRPKWFQAAADGKWDAFTASVRPNDIQRVAINYLRPENLQISVVGPLDSARAVALAFADAQFLGLYNKNAEPLSPYGPVPDGMTALDVIRSHYDACGGEQAFAALKSCRREGTMEANGGMIMDMLAEEVYGVGHRTAISIDGQVMMENVVQPGEGRSLQMGRPRPMPEVEYRRYEPGLYAADMLALEERDLTAGFIGTYQRVDGTEWVVELNRDGARVQRLFFDARTHLLLRSEEHRTGPTGPVQVFVAYDEYHEFDGLQYATKITRLSNNQRMVLTLESVEPDARIDKSQFEWE